MESVKHFTLFAFRAKFLTTEGWKKGGVFDDFVGFSCACDRWDFAVWGSLRIHLSTVEKKGTREAGQVRSNVHGATAAGYTGYD